jgi:hypothetical protein
VAHCASMRCKKTVQESGAFCPSNATKQRRKCRSLSQELAAAVGRIRATDPDEARAMLVAFRQETGL